MDKSKNDYEFREPGDQFDFNLEVTLRKGDDFQKSKEIIQKILGIMEHPFFRIGALGVSGFGTIKVSAVKFRAYSFEEKEDQNAWFDFLKNGLSTHFEIKAIPATINNLMKISGTFHIKSSLLTSAYPMHEEGPDKVPLQRKQSILAPKQQKFILSGKAIRGAFRHRALKICKTMEVPEPETIVEQLFGIAGKNKNSLKSKIYIEESQFNASVQKMIQDRIKIDRWTGGVIGGAKFDSEPLWKKDEDTFSITLFLKNSTNQEISLVLQVLKDLFTSDLAIGGEKNVGRGILVGKTLDFEHNGNEAGITSNNSEGIKINNPSFFESFQFLNHE